MTAQSEPSTTNRGPANGSLGQAEPEEAVLNLIPTSTTSDPCSRELEQLEADSKEGQNRPRIIPPASIMSGTTQTIPTRCIRSPRRLLEVLKTKYGEGGYTVEMRHNVYTVVTRDGKGKLSEDEIRDC
ncbi:hypothetical protein QBC37DRAFT_419070 [Rhypophila decipiens]|uniref:Uncharacterized protein n=1 Tax=Rhypophila decipiens TaxID=261697 RepID=A0AAN6YA59_9PEZI|nr:hypothetical protein QBC37DRAFT_419070 [Rhypophila decipiens]